jgi:hypothetical protein
VQYLLLLYRLKAYVLLAKYLLYCPADRLFFLASLQQCSPLALAVVIIIIVAIIVVVVVVIVIVFSIAAPSFLCPLD